MVVVAIVLSGSVATGQTAAKRQVPTEYTGTTANLTPGSGNKLSIQVVNWSTDSDRQSVLSVIESISAEDTALQDLTKQLGNVQTVGHIWPDGALGYSLKYAHRVPLPDGGERVTVVTDRPLGAWDRPGPWKADGQDSKIAPFTIVELHLNKNGKGEGKMSLATPFAINKSDQTVSLSNYDSAAIMLKGVERRPPPYWARD